MAQWVQALAAVPDNLSSVPRSNMTEEEEWLVRAAIWPSYVYRGMGIPHTYAQ